jgi:hypothetical protein
MRLFVERSVALNGGFDRVRFGQPVRAGRRVATVSSASGVGGPNAAPPRRCRREEGQPLLPTI